MSATDSPTNRLTGACYLGELMKELQLMTELYESNHSVKFRNAHNLLIREIQRVLKLNTSALPDASPRAMAGTDPDASIVEMANLNLNLNSPSFLTMGKSMGDDRMSLSSQRNNSLLSPISMMTTTPKRGTTWCSPSAVMMTGGGALSVSPERMIDCDNNKGTRGTVEKSDKLVFPKETAKNTNLIGRLIGPRGMTIRQLEKDLNCKLFIRGKGCTKDDAKETRLRGKPGWEHLDEPIHVLISTRAETEEQCLEKLCQIKTSLEHFLETPDAELKKAQLMQLAVIEGTLK